MMKTTCTLKYSTRCLPDRRDGGGSDFNLVVDQLIWVGLSTGSLIIQLAYVLTLEEEEEAMMMMEMSVDNQMSNEDKMSNDDKAASKRDECETSTFQLDTSILT
jgi:hypothetical protein